MHVLLLTGKTFAVRRNGMEDRGRQPPRRAAMGRRLRWVLLRSWGCTRTRWRWWTPCSGKCKRRFTCLTSRLFQLWGKMLIHRFTVGIRARVKRLTLMAPLIVHIGVFLGYRILGTNSSTRLCSFRIEDRSIFGFMKFRSCLKLREILR